MRKLSGAFGRLVLFALSFCMSLLLVELTMRAFYGHYLGNWGERAVFFSYDSVLGWRGQPDIEGRFQRSDFSIAVRHNGYGYRDSEPIVERTTDIQRILLLGDSYAWGYGVAEEESFASLLESGLPATEIINLGCSGYGTDQELLLLERDGIRFLPDLIIVLVSLPSDFENNTHAVQYGYPKPYFALESDTLVRRNIPVPRRSLAQRVACCLTRRSALYNYIQARRIPWPFRTDAAPKDVVTDQVLITAELLKEIGRVGECYGAGVLIVLNPTISAKSYGMYRSPKLERLEAMLVDGGLDAINLSRLLSEHMQAKRGRLVFEHDSHWNEVGHELVAAAIKEALHDLQPLGSSAE